MGLLDDFASYFEPLTRNFTGRQWLVQRVRKFLDDPAAPRYLLITAAAGIGKSAFAAYLWRKLGIPDAVHFCIGDNAVTVEPGEFVASMAEQLNRRLPGFDEELVEAERAYFGRNVVIDAQQTVNSLQGGVAINVLIGELRIGKEIPPASAFYHFIQGPLQALNAKGKLPPTVLLVDSLDEAVARKASPNIVNLLAQAQDLPAKVRLILTSRPHVSIVNELFAAIPHVSIDAQSQDNRDDVAHYLLDRLGKDAGLRQAVTAAGWDESRFVAEVGRAGEWNLAVPQNSLL
jgi:hypothetical protein